MCILVVVNSRIGMWGLQVGVCIEGGREYLYAVFLRYGFCIAKYYSTSLQQASNGPTHVTAARATAIAKVAHPPQTQ